jgi:sulfofructose kinase
MSRLKIAENRQRWVVMKNKRWDVLAFGVVAVDDLVYVEHYPLSDSKTPVKNKMRQGGGLAGTAMVAASRLGVKAAYCGVLGDDELSRYTIEELEREKVDCTPVFRRPEARPIHSIIIVEEDTGHRTILFSLAGITEPSPEMISDDLIASCKVLFVDNFGINASLQAMELAHRHGIPVVADVEYKQSSRLPELVCNADHLIIGLAAGNMLTGKSDPIDIVTELARPERACCALTAGEHGGWFSEYGGKIEHFPAHKLQIVDTTGCGDVFHGAYAASLARGESVRDAIRIANAVAGIKATQPGGRSGIPDMARVREFLEMNGTGTHE